MKSFYHLKKKKRHSVGKNIVQDHFVVFITKTCHSISKILSPHWEMARVAHEVQGRGQTVGQSQQILDARKSHSYTTQNTHSPNQVEGILHAHPGEYNYFTI